MATRPESKSTRSSEREPGPAATKIAEAVSASWQTLKLEEGWETFSGEYGDLRVRLEGDVVRLEGVVRGLPVWQQSPTIATLPDGLRPSRRVVTVGLTDGQAPNRIDVFPDGKVQAIAGGPSYWTISATFPVS